MNTPLDPALGALKAAAFNPHNLGTSTPIRGTEVGLRVGKPRTRTVGTRGRKPSATPPPHRSNRRASYLARAGGTAWMILGLVLGLGTSPAHASWAPMSSLRQNTASSGNLAVIYSQTNFAGDNIPFTEERDYTASELGFAATGAASMQVAPGYRVRLTWHPVAETLDIVKPEDDADFSDDKVLTNLRRLRIEKVPTQVPTRPNIYICLHGNNELADATKTSQWDYVRKKVDGIWYNASFLNGVEIRQLITNLTTRRVVTELNNYTEGPGDFQLAPNSSPGWVKPLANTGPNAMMTADPTLQLELEAVALFKTYREIQLSNGTVTNDALLKWTDSEWQWLINTYMVPANSTDRPFPALYTGWQPQAFGYRDNNPPTLELFSGDPAEAAQVTYAQAAFDNSAGLFLECSPSLMVGSITGRAAVKKFLTKCEDRPFFWFMPPHYPSVTDDVERAAPAQVQLEKEYVQYVKNAYYIMEAEGLIREQDVYFPVNYAVQRTEDKKVIPRIASLPETNSVGEPARSFTGILYWLLRQSDETLMEIDFNSPMIGGPAKPQIPVGDQRLATANPAVTFAGTGPAVTLLGGTSGTAVWASSLDGQSINNPDLHTQSTFGAPTRFDFRLGFAAPGMTYTVTGVSVVVATADANNVQIGLNYRRGGNDISGPMTTIPQNTPATYHLDATAHNLTATANSTSWDMAAGLRVEFYEPNGGDTDQLAVRQVTVHGTVNGIPAILTEVKLSQPDVPTILARNDPQIVAHEGMTFPDATRVAFVNGGNPGSGTAKWNYSGGGTTALNRDLYTIPLYGNPTRISASMGRAASGKRYKITRADVIVSAADTKDIYFGFSCKKSGTITSGPTGVIKANTPGIYALDLRTVGLQATDSSTTWDVADGLRFEFYQPNGADVDMLAIDKVVFYGVVE